MLTATGDRPCELAVAGTPDAKPRILTDVGEMELED